MNLKARTFRAGRTSIPESAFSRTRSSDYPSAQSAADQLQSVIPAAIWTYIGTRVTHWFICFDKDRSKRRHAQLDERILYGISAQRPGRPGTKYRGHRSFEGSFLRVTH